MKCAAASSRAADSHESGVQMCDIIFRKQSVFIAFPARWLGSAVSTLSLRDVSGNW